MAKLFDHIALSGAVDTDGTVLAGGTLYTYTTGASTLADYLYTDAALTTPMTQGAPRRRGGHNAQNR